MEKEFEKYKKIEISQFRIKNKLEEGPHWTVYKVESKFNKNVIYAAKVISKESNENDNNPNKYFNKIKKELKRITNSPINSPYLFKGLSLTDFNGHRNITIFLHYKKYYNYLKMVESFINYPKIDITQFKIKATMGKGAYGTVYKVVNKKNPNEIYAAKKIKNDCKDDERRMYQYSFGIKREIDAMINGNNPTLLQFKGLSLTDFSGENNVTVFTSFASKGSLTNICFQSKNSPPNYDNTARQIILVGISYGMMILYKNMMIHRDFKPDNVLLDKDLHPMIGDFGFSKTINPKSSFNNSMYCGTYYYMAPELLTAFFTDESPKYNRSVDVYAFGVSMYEVVTKNHAYENNISLRDLYSRVVLNKKRPPFNNNVKGSIQKLIDKCWAPEIEDRISFEQIFYMLAFNIEEKKSQNSYNKYYLDGVDVDRLFDYIGSIIDHNIDLEVLLEKLRGNLNDNVSVLENNKSLSKDAVKTINDVIRNKKKLIEKIEQIKLQPPKNIPIDDKFNANSSPDFDPNANMMQNQQNPIKSVPPINLKDLNQTNPESPNQEQNQLQENPESPKNQQNQFQEKPESPNPEQNQNQTKPKSNPDSPQQMTDTNKNEKPQRAKTPLKMQARNQRQGQQQAKSPRGEAVPQRGRQNQQRKTQLNAVQQNQKQGQPRAKSPRGEVTHKQDNLKGTNSNQPKKSTYNAAQIQQHPNSSQKPAQSRTPNNMMHILNEQIKTPLKSTIQKMTQDNLDKSQSKKAINELDKNPAQAQSASSNQSKRAATPDNNLTYMLRKKKDLRYQIHKRKQENREQTQQQTQQTTKPPKTQQQQQEEEQTQQTTKPPKTQQEQEEDQQIQQQQQEQQTLHPQNNVQYNQNNDHDLRRVPKVPEQQLNVINRNQPQKKRSKTPDNLIRRTNKRGQSPLNYVPQHPRPRDNFNIDFDSYNLNYQSKSKANRDPRRNRLDQYFDRNRNNQKTTLNPQRNKQNKKQGNRARLMRREKFKI